MMKAVRTTLGPSVVTSAAIPLINNMMMAYKAFRQLYAKSTQQHDERIGDQVTL